MSTRPRKSPSGPSSASSRADREQTSPSAPGIRVRVDFYDRCSVGTGKIRLLEAVERTGSLSQAAREIAMSYRRAWLLIDSMNTEFDTPVISATVGGSGGGGAKLTSFGREMISAYRALESRLAALAAEHLGGIAAHALDRRRRAPPGGLPPREKISRPLKRAR